MASSEGPRRRELKRWRSYGLGGAGDDEKLHRWVDGDLPRLYAGYINAAHISPGDTHVNAAPISPGGTYR